MFKENESFQAQTIFDTVDHWLQFQSESDSPIPSPEPVAPSSPKRKRSPSDEDVEQLKAGRQI